MAEYIKREALRKTFEKWRSHHEKLADDYGVQIMEDAIWELNAQTAADVAPVVRCKDCTHTTLYEDSEGLYCTNICGLFTRVMDDDYCSYGERKDGDAK